MPLKASVSTTTRNATQEEVVQREAAESGRDGENFAINSANRVLGSCLF